MDVVPVCNTLLPKLWELLSVAPGTVVNWRQFVNQLSPPTESGDAMMARLQVEFGGSLTPEELAVLARFKGLSVLTDIDGVEIDCASMAKILELDIPGEENSEEQGGGEMSSDSDDEEPASDEEDEDEEGAVQTLPAPGPTLPAPVGVFGLPPTPIYGGSVAQPTLPVPSPGPTLPQPGGFVLPAPAPNVGGTLPAPGPTMPTLLGNQAGEDLPYATVWVGGIKPSEKAKYYMFEIPEYAEGVDPANPGDNKPINQINIGLFLTGGAPPKNFTKTVFNNEEFDAANKPQMAAIHAQNGARFQDLLAGKIPVGPIGMAQLSDGKTPDAISASSGFRMAGKVVRAVNLDMTGKTSKPRSNRGSSVAPPSGGGFGFTLPATTGASQVGPTQPAPLPGMSTVAAPTSGPVSSTRALPLDPNTQQALALPPGAQVVKVVPIDAKVNTANPDPAAALDAYWLPGGPRPFAIDVKGTAASMYSWFVMPNGDLVKSDTKTMAPGQAPKGKAVKGNQAARVQQAFAIVASWNQGNPGWFQPFGVAGAVPVGGSSMKPVATAPFPPQPSVAPPTAFPFMTQPAAPSLPGTVQPSQPANPFGFQTSAAPVAAPTLPSTLPPGFGQGTLPVPTPSGPPATAPPPTVLLPGFGMVSQPANPFGVQTPAAPVAAPTLPTTLPPGFGQGTLPVPGTTSQPAPSLPGLTPTLPGMSATPAAGSGTPNFLASLMQTQVPSTLPFGN